ncbi:MAG: Tim44 domain-containing protein [Magnetococcales bacterium]|nr:Tim44 domain-containing protein [Magnetococcales bacterium]
MKNTITICFTLLLFLLAGFALLTPDEAMAARMGGGSSVGSRGSKSFSPPQQATQRSAQPAMPAQHQATPASSGSRWGSGLLGGIGGFMLGGLLGSMLFGGGAGGGIGFLEILLIGGGIFLLIRWLRNRRPAGGMDHAPQQPVEYSTPYGGHAMPTSFPQSTTPRVSLDKNPLPQTFSMGGGTAGPVDTVSQGLAQITSMDPSFNEGHFLMGAQGAFQQLQAAWSNWNIDRLRPLLTERMWAIVQQQASERQAAGRRDVVDRIRFLACEISEAWQEAGENWITVHFAIEMIEYETDMNGRVTNGNPSQPVQAEEYWTFCRPVGATNPNWLLSAIQQPGEVARGTL